MPQFRLFTRTIQRSSKIMAEQTPATNGAAALRVKLGLQNINVRAVSFEVPNATAVYQEEGQPQVQLSLSLKNGQIGEGAFVVVLTLTVTCTLNERTA